MRVRSLLGQGTHTPSPNILVIRDPDVPAGAGMALGGGEAGRRRGWFRPIFSWISSLVGNGKGEDELKARSNRPLFAASKAHIDVLNKRQPKIGSSPH